MSNESMNVALPEAMKEFVLQQVAAGGYSTASEYVRELIRGDQKRKAEERLEAMLLEGLDGENSKPLTKAEWNALRAQVKARLKQRRPT